MGVRREGESFENGRREKGLPNQAHLSLGWLLENVGEGDCVRELDVEEGWSRCSGLC